MTRFFHRSDWQWRQQYGAIALLAGLVLGGLALKLPAISNANIPTVLPGGEQKNPLAMAIARAERRQDQVQQIQAENFDLKRFPVNSQTEKHWRNILWTTAIVQPKEDFVADAIAQLLGMSDRTGLSNAHVRTIDMATQVGTQLYLSDPIFYAKIGQQFLHTLERSLDPQWVAVSLSTLTKAGMTLDERQRLIELVKRRFPNWANNVVLQTTITGIDPSSPPSSLPPLQDLLTWAIAPQQLQLYVFCRPDRQILCQSVLKDQNGEFVRQDGQLWTVPLLLRSLHGLSWNFVRGQTPQGIYRIEGSVPQPDTLFFRAYGQFSLINLYVPFESGVKQFLPGKPGRFTGSLSDYQALLPPSWRRYVPIQESYWAGKIGRSLFRIHGTGESPDFFSGKQNNPDTYNWNPTIGCLSALELYNEKGQLLQADMPKILNALERVGGQDFAGYLIVVDLPGTSKQPVSLDEINAAIAGNPPNGSIKSRINTQPVTPRVIVPRSPITQQISSFSDSTPGSFLLTPQSEQINHTAVLTPNPETRTDSSLPPSVNSEPPLPTQSQPLAY